MAIARSRYRLAASALAALIALAVACSDEAPAGTAPTAPTATPAPTPIYDGPGERLSIQSATQAHLDGVAIGAGNIWEEDYVAPDGSMRRGLTALLFISIAADPAQNHQVRVHPGQELDVPGYHLSVLAIEERHVHLAVEKR